MEFIEWVVVEFVLLLAAGLTVTNGVGGLALATAILSGVIWYAQPDHFWYWQVGVLLGGAFASGISLWLGRKSGQNSLLTGVAGGLTGLVLLGAMFPLFIAFVLWALTVGTGLLPRLQRKSLVWEGAPLLWRVLAGFSWVVLGNLLV